MTTAGALLLLACSAFAQTQPSPVVPVTSYVNSGQILLVADLLTTYPCVSATQNLYAHVSDLYNNGVAGKGIDEILRCRFDVTNSAYRWTPQRPEYVVDLTTTGGAITFTSLVTPPTIRLTGTLVSNSTITLSATNAYIGQRVNIVQNSTLGIFTSTITGLIGSNLTLLSGSAQQMEYGPSGWFKAN